MIVAKSLSRHYGHGEVMVKALSDVSLVVNPGEKIAILGRSGSGKSTFLNLIAAMDSPTSGKLTVNDIEPAELDSDQKSKFRLTEIGVVFQSFQLIPQRTAFQNVELPLIVAGCPKAERADRVSEMLQRVGLKHRIGHRPWQLSGGEQQRVSIARAMINRPGVILADEPTGNLDTNNSNSIVDLMLEVLDADKATLVLITHDRELASRVADRTETLADGRLVEA